ncbi:NAD(P)/FAD-dependent oxidoreductase [Anabaena cylindrica FACHB-243]|uniref:NADH:ubiquinone reductase (non-electrogenic) n=1 Tax=Anabaena cylindrica (strain ATCC 27899 / PCC 7122) TaxID=272123 RepID=K9ZEE3_ANACC|nr:MULTISPECIES: NAD(P)/FAD-dependent oxidoreductase [Anabaena]AFZ57561.1 NADH dehydrogenase (ubiquinone) [Anabaena cylindrica PCC 7122]MBD2418498.1 NAD(P)/FAD-dependent oxidoreductase [Anabaena cylindrica FACHB-243]MBY5283709.1 NAD(P)/FAD-dependent oxidoreductase [Anabaena sp. CCAP 1446/1C]MBY5308485.1 NAD(P)/FAD-dependent oxidoreductase [Anabaena sp. CCAP 1446/1C]MCM2405074.1 NAD(P)/FAD-dependent oxidoreductase [Anabaena sp. CCAP 1446/1C]
MVDAHENNPPHEVVIVGGGFGGLYAAKSLKKANVNVTLIDKRNFHLFQPLLYQVATGALSPADISSPLRSVLSKSKNTKVLLGEVDDINPDAKQVIVSGEAVRYDTLIVATGAKHSYFGKDDWEEFAPGLKTVEDAIAMRHRIFMAFEAAEKESDPVQRQAWLTFVIVGGGPTGVELAGAIAELATKTLKEDFRNIDTSEARILLLEGMDRILPPFAPELSQEAETSLTQLGVNVQTKTLVTNIADDIVTIKQGEDVKEIAAKTVLWAAGVKASAMGKVLTERTGAESDRAGRVIVEPDLSIKGHPNIFVVGDLANFAHQNNKPLPGVAPVAMQEGEYVAKLIQKRLKGETLPQFNYVDRGSLAMIGQHAAVVDLGFIKLKGFFAWFFWLFVHIYFLIEFDNKLVVMIQWIWNYFTRNRGARLITGKENISSVAIDSNGNYQPVKTRQPLSV